MKKVMLFITILFSGVATAATFDFAAYADNDGEAGYVQYDRVEGGQHLHAQGGTLNATGTAGNQTHAYLDAGNAGLGVCSTGLDNSAQCIDSSDDNILPGEAVAIWFDENVTLTDVTFRDAWHGTNFAKDAYFMFGQGVIGSINWVQVSLSGLVSLSGIVGATNSNDFWFWNKGSDQFYISSLSAVPVPAALFLFAPALLGFLGLRRKAALAA